MRSLRRWFSLGCATVVVGSALAATPHKDRIIFQHLSPTSIGLFLADANGQHERPLLPATSLDYNASFSAGGKWIIFTSERTGTANIYRVHPDGSGLEQLTDSPSFDDQGSLSPDGSTLAFVSTREGGTANIWLLDLISHRYTNLTRDEAGNFRPSWSPDGEWIAFTSDRNVPHRRYGAEAAAPAGSGCCGWELLHSTAVYIVSSKGHGLRRLTPLDQTARSPKWSSDGKQLIYAEGDGGRKPLQIASVDIASGQIQVLTKGDGGKVSPQYLNATEIGYLQASAGGSSVLMTAGIKGPLMAGWSPSWSPDGKLVVYAKSFGQFESGLKLPVAYTSASRDSVFDFYRIDALHCVAYSHDGRQLAMSSCVRGQKTLMMLNADGTGFRKLFDATAQGTSVVSPSWSPDGRYIAFSVGPRGLGIRNPISSAQIALIRSDGSDLKILTRDNNDNAYPSFSPDGKHLVFRVLGASQQGLRILSLGDGKITKLTAEWDNFPEWAPDGDRILFTSFRTGDFEIYTIRSDGSGLRQLTHDYGNDAHAIWSPDGKQILFTSSRMGWRDDENEPGEQPYGKLFVMRADGSELRQLTDNRWEEGPVAWLPAAQVLSRQNARH